MKKLLFVLMVLPFVAFKCHKSSKDDNDGYLRGKVIRTSCSGLVIQVLNDDNIGDDGWKDILNKNIVYDNVFGVINSCKLGDAGKVGNMLHFKITQPTASGCMFCQIYDAPPKAQYDAIDVTVEK